MSSNRLTRNQSETIKNNVNLPSISRNQNQIHKYDQYVNAKLDNIANDPAKYETSHARQKSTLMLLSSR